MSLKDVIRNNDETGEDDMKVPIDDTSSEPELDEEAMVEAAIRAGEQAAEEEDRQQDERPDDAHFARRLHLPARQEQHGAQERRDCRQAGPR